MILIFSIHEDPSTNHIVDWLTYYGEKVFRINSSDDVVKYFERFPNTFLSSNSSELKNDSIKSVWFRRPPLCITHPIFRNREKKMIDSFFTSEHKAVFDILFTTLKNKGLRVPLYVHRLPRVHQRSGQYLFPTRQMHL